MRPPSVNAGLVSVSVPPVPCWWIVIFSSPAWTPLRARPIVRRIVFAIVDLGLLLFASTM
jgi:hypothetical protein